ncbi:putative GTP-ase activating protein, partial [Oesophagostomum dentatum]
MEESVPSSEAEAVSSVEAEDTWESMKDLATLENADECIKCVDYILLPEIFQHFSGMLSDPDVMMEGYLSKRSSNAFETWNKRWFQIKDNELESRPSSSRKSENRKSETDVNNMQSGVLAVAVALSTFEQIRRVPGNERCANCGSEQPKWVSINLVVVLCFECSGVHHSTPQFRSTNFQGPTMDSIDPELRGVLLSLGNSQVNAVFFAHLLDKDAVPHPAVDNSNRQELERWAKRLGLALLSKIALWRYFDRTKQAVDNVFSTHESQILDRVRREYE